MQVIQRPLRPRDPTSIIDNILVFADTISDRAKDGGFSVSDLLIRIGGIKIVPSATTETVGESFESMVTKKQTINGKLIVLGQNTIL